MAKKVAGSRKVKVVESFPGAAAVIGIVPSGEGYQVQVENREDFPVEDIVEMLHDAADTLGGKHDRTRGMF